MIPLLNCLYISLWILFWTPLTILFSRVSNDFIMAFCCCITFSSFLCIVIIYISKCVLTVFFQVTRLNASYPGGIVQYINNARELLADSKAGKNPFDGFTPSVSRMIHS